MTATLRTGSPEANQSSALSMSMTPPNSLVKNSIRVETSAAGGRMKIRSSSSLLLKIITRPPMASNAETAARKIIVPR